MSEENHFGRLNLATTNNEASISWTKVDQQKRRSPEVRYHSNYDRFDNAHDDASIRKKKALRWKSLERFYRNYRYSR